MTEPDGATPLDPDELEGLKFQHVTTRDELNHLEQANIQNGLIWLNRNREKDILTEAFVRKLHKHLFGDVWQWAGTFRQTEKNIGVDPVTIGVELRTLLGDVQYWSKHKTYPPMEAAARFHHRLALIHPFPNGNGRHARIMADVVLNRIFDAEALNWAGGQDLQTMGDRRKNYIAALRAADKGNYLPLFQFVGIET